jgi:hypothetical protein
MRLALLERRLHQCGQAKDGGKALARGNFSRTFGAHFSYISVVCASHLACLCDMLKLALIARRQMATKGARESSELIATVMGEGWEV